jgi:hypothetical protein
MAPVPASAPISSSYRRPSPGSSHCSSPRELAPPDVKAAVGQHVEREPSAGAEFQYPDAPPLAVADRDQPDARDLFEPPDAAQQLSPLVAGTEQLRHVPGVPDTACQPSVPEVAAAERGSSPRPPTRLNHQAPSIVRICQDHERLLTAAPGEDQVRGLAGSDTVVMVISDVR